MNTTFTDGEIFMTGFGRNIHLLYNPANPNQHVELIGNKMRAKLNSISNKDCKKILETLTHKAQEWFNEETSLELQRLFEQY